jgi:ubiquitin C-terminal hydrolase
VTEYLPPASASPRLRAATADSSAASSLPALDSPAGVLLLGLGSGSSLARGRLASLASSAGATPPRQASGPVAEGSSTPGSGVGDAAAPTSPLLLRLPSYVPQALRPDPDALVKVVFDDGERLRVPLRQLRFCWHPDDRLPGRPPEPGAVGLLNLGNTCYLNSVLQAVSHVDALTAYCLDPGFANHLNTRNKLGMQGRMAVAFADLLQHLWGDGCAALAPSFVKALLSEKNSTFNGMGQQDAHEALMCLLDGLHEDLAVPDHAASEATQMDARAAAEEDARERAQAEARELVASRAQVRAVAKGAVSGRSAWAVIMGGGVAGASGGSGGGGGGMNAAISNSARNGAGKGDGAERKQDGDVDAGEGKADESKSGAGATAAVVSLLASSAEPPAAGAALASGWFSSAPWSRRTSRPEPPALTPATAAAAAAAVSSAASSSAESPLAAGVAADAPAASAAAQPQAQAAASRPFLETTSIIKQLFFVQTQVEFVCQRNSRHVQRRHGPRGGEMLPPLPLAAQKETREGWLRRRVVRDPVLAVSSCCAQLEHVLLCSPPTFTRRPLTAPRAFPFARSFSRPPPLRRLKTCLDNFFAPEVVERKCDRCARVVPMSSRTWLKALPPVLVVQLKRFEYSASGENAKLADAIPFPLRDLDMAPYVLPRGAGGAADGTSPSLLAAGLASLTSPLASSAGTSPTGPAAAAAAAAGAGAGAAGGTAAPSPSAAGGAVAGGPDSGTLYDLFGIVCHVGSAERGHYTAFSRSIASGSDWHYYDDALVTPVREDEVASERVASLAYVLFYARRRAGAAAPQQSAAAQARELAWRLAHPPAPPGPSTSSSSSSSVSSSASLAKTAASRDAERERSLATDHAIMAFASGHSLA